MSKNYSQLSLDERRTMYKFLEYGRSKTSIADYLGRHRATIFREVRREMRVRVIGGVLSKDHVHKGVVSCPMGCCISPGFAKKTPQRAKNNPKEIGGS